MALTLILGVVIPPLSSEAAASSKKKITVSTQKELDEALKSGKYTSIVIKTDANVKITLKKKYASLNVEITVKAPNCDLVSNGAFKSITVTDANTVTEKASGNNYTIKDRDLTITVTEKAKVDGIKVLSKKGNVSLVNDGTVKRVDVEGKSKVDIEQNGKVKRVYVNSDTEITVTGDSEKAMNVTFKKGATGATLATDIPVKVNSYAQVNLELSETAKESTVNNKSDESKVEIVNTVIPEKEDKKDSEEKKDESKEDKKDSEEKKETGADKTEEQQQQQNTPTAYEELKSKLAYASLSTADKTVKLTSNVVLAGNIIVPENVIVDLNGYTLNAGDYTIFMKHNSVLDVTKNSKLIANHIMGFVDDPDPREGFYCSLSVRIRPTGQAVLGGVTVTAGPEEHPSLVGGDLRSEVTGVSDDMDGKTVYEFGANMSIEVKGESLAVSVEKSDIELLCEVFKAADYYKTHFPIDADALGFDQVEYCDPDFVYVSYYPNFRFAKQKFITSDTTEIYTVKADDWLDVYMGIRDGWEDIEDAINNYGVTPPFDITATQDGDIRKVTLKSNDGSGKVRLEYLDVPEEYSLTLKEPVEINTANNIIRYALSLRIEGELKSESDVSNGIGLIPSENGCIAPMLWEGGKIILSDGSEIYLTDVPKGTGLKYVQFYIQNSVTELGTYNWVFTGANNESESFKIMMKKDNVETEVVPDPVSGMLRPKNSASGKITKLTELMSVLDWSAWTANKYYTTHDSYDGLYEAYPMLKDTFVVEKGSEIKIGKIIGNYDNEFESEYVNISLEDKDNDKSTLKIGKDHYYVVSCNSSINIPSLGYRYTQDGETSVVSPGALELEFDSNNASFIVADDGASIRIGNMLIETPSREGIEPDSDEYKTFPVYISPEKKNGSVVYNIILSPEDKFFVVSESGEKTPATLVDINAWLQANHLVVPEYEKGFSMDGTVIKVGGKYAVYNRAMKEYEEYTIDLDAGNYEIKNQNDLSVIASMITCGDAENDTFTVTSGSAINLNRLVINNNNTLVASEGSTLTLSASGMGVVDNGKFIAASGSAIVFDGGILVAEITGDASQLEISTGVTYSGKGAVFIVYDPSIEEQKIRAIEASLSKLDAEREIGVYSFTPEQLVEYYLRLKYSTGSGND